MYGTYKIYKDGNLISEQKNKLTVLGRANALKAMLGQNQYFANSFGIGVSSKANASTKFLDMTDLDFTVGKFPISMGTLGTTQDSSTDGLVYTARITDTSRYYITEIGLFSNIINGAVDIDDLTIFDFEDGEQIKETPSTFTATISNGNPSVFTSNSHGLVNGDSITLTTTNTLPGGLQTNTTYYVINSTINTFNVSLTYGGDAVATNTNGSGTHTINPTTVYVSESLFSNRRGSSLVSDLLYYRIGNDAVKITGNKTIFYDDTYTNLSNVGPKDNFTLAAYNPFSATHIVNLKFTSSSNSTLIYSFSLAPNKYNIVSLARENVSFDWFNISKIEIYPTTLGTSPEGTPEYIILDGLRVKYNNPTDAVDGLVSRAVLTTPIEKDSGSIIDIQYILSMGLDTV